MGVSGEGRGANRVRKRVELSSLTRMQTQGQGEDLAASLEVCKGLGGGTC